MRNKFFDKILCYEKVSRLQNAFADIEEMLGSVVRDENYTIGVLNDEGLKSIKRMAISYL